MRAVVVVAAALALAQPMLDAPAQARGSGLTIVAANIRSYPLMTRAHYRHDIRRVVTIRGRKWVAGAEIQRRHGERRIWTRLWHRAGYRTVRPRVEVTQAVWHRFKVVGSRIRFLHARAPGPTSPPRRAVVTRMRVSGYRVAGISLHLTNGCFAGKRDRWWYAARCRALRVEIARVRRWVAELHSHGWTVTVGGDMNRHRAIDWCTCNQQARTAGLMQLAVIPAKGVHARLARFRVIPTSRLFTDHAVPIVHVVLRRFTR